MKILLHIFLLLIPIMGFPQGTPQGISYQAVAYDSEGFEISNQDISIRLSILLGGVDLEASYTEIHSVTTDDFGLFSLVISEGETSDTFSSINWEEGAYLKVEVDANLDGEYSVMGVNSFNAVPYALYSQNTASDSILSILQETVNQFPDPSEFEQLRLEIDSLHMVLNNNNTFNVYQLGLNDTISLDVTSNRSVILTGYMQAYYSGCALQMRITDSNFNEINEDNIKGGGWMQWDGDSSYEDHHSELNDLPIAPSDDDRRNFYYSLELSHPMELKIYLEILGSPNWYGYNSCGCSADVKIQY